MALLVIGSLLPASLLVGVPATRPAHPHVRCCDSAAPAMPAGADPSQLADAWRRDEKAKDLAEMLKGCSIYVVGAGGRKTAVARVLARRLCYRCYDISNLMCTTYSALSGDSETPVSLPQLLAKEPLADVEQLASAVLSEVQQFTRSVFVTWDGAVDMSAFAVMQQGLVVHLDFEATVDDDVALPADDAEETLERWREGHAKADLTITIAQGTAADDAAYQMVNGLVDYIAANPAKNVDWKAEADAKLAEQES